MGADTPTWEGTASNGKRTDEPRDETLPQPSAHRLRMGPATQETPQPDKLGNPVRRVCVFLRALQLAVTHNKQATLTQQALLLVLGCSHSQAPLAPHGANHAADTIQLVVLHLVKHKVQESRCVWLAQETANHPTRSKVPFPQYGPAPRPHALQWW